jgi:hypothetical protein
MINLQKDLLGWFGFCVVVEWMKVASIVPVDYFGISMRKLRVEYRDYATLYTYFS